MSDRNITKPKSIKGNPRTPSKTSNSEKKTKPHQILIDNDQQKKFIKEKEEQSKMTEEEETTDDDNEKTDDENKENHEEVNIYNQSSSRLQPQRTSNSNETHETSSSKMSSTQKLFLVLAVLLVPVSIKLFSSLGDSSNSSSNNNNNWRSKVDPNDSLSNKQQSIVRASLKPILDQSSTRQEEGVSTLLILSSNEESAAKLARCLLGLVNERTNKDQISTEIDLRSHRGGKFTLDSNLRTLLTKNNAIRAVLLRHIDNIPSNDALEQARLLFAYCDGENPVIPHRLIIMTATSNSENETELREKFKTRWPADHDFVDALMSRISGHTLYVEKEQKSIC